MNSRLGELLVRRGRLTPAQLDQAVRDVDADSNALAPALVRSGLFTDADLTAYLQAEYRLEAVNPAAAQVAPEIVRLVPAVLARRHHFVPLRLAGSTLTLAMSDPSNLVAINEVKFLSGYDVKVAVATVSAVSAAIDRLYEDRAADYHDVLAEVQSEDIQLAGAVEEIDLQELERATEDAPVVRLVNAILTSAIKRRASDIHLEPYEKMLRIRYRIDGVLEEIMKPPLKLRNAMTSRLKVMARLDIAERRLPQDGRIKLKVGLNKDMDFRVSALPTIFGEKMVLRILDKSALQLDMTKLGFTESALHHFRDAIYKPYGMVLVTGPTGSGKTTTLYSALSELNKVASNISTAEDPVEFNLVGINQVQIHEEIGLTFANTLRSFLRQDPDIIMLGEIRDVETAAIAIKAALTGHLVLSTLHTNDAPSSITRLLNMGVEPFLVASSINLVLAQRLVRIVCGGCRLPTEIPAHVLTEIGVQRDDDTPLRCVRGGGCPLCGGSGYRGRVAVYEVMPMSETVRDLILSGASEREIKRAAVAAGMATLRQSAITLLRQGITSADEVVRVTMPD